MLALVLLGSTQCVTLRHQAAMTGLESPEARTERIDEALSTDWDDAPSVCVVWEGLPEGIARTDAGITVLPEHQATVQNLGSVRIGGPTTGHQWQHFFWNRPLHSTHGGFRKGFCGAQAPLRAVTLTLWNWLTPFGWFCIPGNGDQSVPTRRRLLFGDLGRLGHRMGGTKVILTEEKFGTGKMWSPSSGSVGGMGGGRKQLVEIQGFVVREQSPSPDTACPPVPQHMSPLLSHP